MKTWKPLMCALILSGLAVAQQHAPTKEQCDADVNLWLGPMVNETVLGSHISVYEIEKRIAEMNTCNQAYPSQKDDYGYYIASQTYSEIYALRAVNFIARHNLTRQF